MVRKISNIQIKKYFPYILLLITVVIGLFLLIKNKILLILNPTTSNTQEVKKPSVVDIIFPGKEYKLSYGDADMKNFINISKFDKNDQWQGEGSIEGESKTENFLNIIDRDRNKTSAYLYKTLDLTSVDKIKLTVNLKTDPDDLESLNIYFGNKDLTSYYRFSVTNLVMGLNYLTIPKYRFFLVEGDVDSSSPRKVAVKTETTRSFDWDKIEKAQFELLSRPSSKATVEIVWLRAEKEDIFTSVWNWDGYEHFLNMDTDQNGISTLLISNIGNRPFATLRKVGSVKDFTYSAKITALKKGSLGLFFRGDYKTGFGYFLIVGGLGNNDWTLSKTSLVNNQAKGTTLASGQVSNFEFSKDQPFDLKVTAYGNEISAYFSLDGNEYTKLAEITDNDFSAGGLGIVISNNVSGYFDEFILNM